MEPQRRLKDEEIATQWRQYEMKIKQSSGNYGVGSDEVGIVKRNKLLYYLNVEAPTNRLVTDGLLRIWKTLHFIKYILQSPNRGRFQSFILSIDGRKPGEWRKNKESLGIDVSVDSRECGELTTKFDLAEFHHSRVFLLPPQTGGLGINLIPSDRMVLFNSHQHPTKDIQAVYSCYGLGKTKPNFFY